MKYYSPEVYAEVYELLSYMDKKEVMKIPLDLLEDIKNSRNKNYESKIDIFDLYNRNNLLPETIEVMAALCVEYLLPQKEKEKIKIEFETNKVKNQKPYNPEDIFNNKVKDIVEEKQIIKANESLLNKIINKLKKFFKIK